ncbi:MAG: pyruvate ferredoxin oxidoreductase [Candidatus Diapherotrites archaeon]|nr:pyruvate ferredoxin oxidoreductase [Candidatus Diapherotrites archaeon]
MTEMVVEASKAIALAAKLCRPKVIPMYPITPQTHIVENLAEIINNGELDAEIIHAESEHSACSALLGAQASGIRTFSATASQGLALMFEVLPIVAGNRMPCVMAVANRALSAPINIWNDHSDAVSVRDQGWIQIYVESTQEAIDTLIQLYRVCESKEVMLPGMLCIDGFTLSHVYERAFVPDQSEVDEFLPEYKPLNILDPANPITMGPIAFPNSYMEFKKMQHEAMLLAKKEIEKANQEFGKKFGRKYGNGLIETYRMEDAKYAIIGMGTLIGTARTVVDKLREKKKKVGLIKLRSLRPFPDEKLRKAIEGLKGLAVIDRHISVGYEGPLYTDLRSAFYGSKLTLSNYIAGLGGRDITAAHIEKVFIDLMNGKSGGWLL